MLRLPSLRPQPNPRSKDWGPVRHYRITVNGTVYETSIQVVSQ